MQRTSFSLLLLLTGLAGAVGYLAQVALAASGASTIAPPLSLSAVLLLIAAALLLSGWPIRQAMRGAARRAIDPFRATRVLSFAKASSVMGALLTGAVLGVLVYMLSRSELPEAGPIALAIVAAVASAAVVTVGLVVESWCRLPPEEPAESPDRGMVRR